jgi:hypothetical protein
MIQDLQKYLAAMIKYFAKQVSTKRNDVQINLLSLAVILLATRF